MKKLTILIAILLIACNQPKEKNTFTLEGNLKNLKDSTLVILGTMDSRNFFYKPLDSMYAKNNQFEFKGKIDTQNQFLISFQPKILNDSLIRKYWRKQIPLFIENPEVKIEGDFNNTKNLNFVGSPFTELSNKFMNIADKYISEMRNGKIDLKDFHRLINKETIDLIFQNPNNPVSLSKILDYENKISKDSLKLFYSKLDKDLLKSANGISLNNFITVSKLKVGDSFIDFQAKDLNGNTVKLSDFKGKIILLDFWAYWCHWCHMQNQEEFPLLKEKYRDLVIISYSVDVDKRLWEKSSEDDKINWVNISNLKGITDKVVLQYDVHAYPTSFLIDQSGIIRNKFLGYERDTIEKSINQLLKVKK